jgi:hypothetical protein
MNRVNIKYAPALKDMTVEDCFSDEGMEAVLCEEEQAKLSRNRKAAGANSSESPDEQSAIYEKPEDAELLKIIRRRDWAELLYRLEIHPHITYIKFAGKSTSTGNLVLHEACRYLAPVDTIEVLIDANEEAVRTKGHSGFLPLHFAYASGASEDVIKLLVSIHPDAIQAADDDSHTLPLHLASKMGASEEAFMTLLTAYPDATQIRDDFGRLPMDYAKTLLNDKKREIAMECLQRARWLDRAAKHAREMTEWEYERRIHGYEESQAAHLKMIKEVHDEEISEMERTIEEQREELSSQAEQIEDLEKKFDDEMEMYKKRIETLEKMVETKDVESSAKIDAQEDKLSQIQIAFDDKTAELKEVSKKLEQRQKENDYLVQQVEAQTRDFHVALEDIETLNKHAEWLESILGSIRDIANSEAPIVSSMTQRREHSNHTGGTTVTDSSRRRPRKGESINTSRAKSKLERNSRKHGRKISSTDPAVISTRSDGAMSEFDVADWRSEEAWDFDPSRDGDVE